MSKTGVSSGAARGQRDTQPSGGVPKSAPTSSVKGSVSGQLYPSPIARPPGVDAVGEPSASDDSPASDEK